MELTLEPRNHTSYLMVDGGFAVIFISYISFIYIGH